MIKIYGMPTCPYCDYIHEQIKGREDEFEYINIGENIRNMGAFMRLRDTNPVFDHLKEIGDVGIPAFVFEDGRVSTDPADAGLIEYGSPNACSIEEYSVIFVSVSRPAQVRAGFFLCARFDTILARESPVILKNIHLRNGIFLLQSYHFLIYDDIHRSDGFLKGDKKCRDAQTIWEMNIRPCPLWPGLTVWTRMF